MRSIWLFFFSCSASSLPSSSVLISLPSVWYAFTTVKCPSSIIDVAWIGWMTWKVIRQGNLTKEDFSSPRLLEV